MSRHMVQMASPILRLIHLWVKENRRFVREPAMAVVVVVHRRWFPFMKDGLNPFSERAAVTMAAD
jgi:hypothetical protein